MDTVLKNILISGAAVFFIVGMFAFVQLQNSQARIEEAERAASGLGQSDARESAESGEWFLLAAAYGWGPSEIPGYDMQRYRECLADVIGLRVFENFGDVSFESSPEDHYQNLIEQPEKTWIYAESFNREMLRSIPSSTESGCRISESV